MPPHNFTIGQRVELVPGRMDANVPRGLYTVERLLPNDSADREYRVRSVQDGHERVLRESQLRKGPPRVFA